MTLFERGFIITEETKVKRKIATLIVGVLLISIVSAGMVSYLSNMVSGSVTVEGPVFYARAITESIPDQDGILLDVHLLSLNHVTTEHIEPFNIDCTFPPGGCEAKFLEFATTKELGINYFYDSNWEFHTNMRLNSKSEETGECKVFAKLLIMSENEGKGEYIEIARSDDSAEIPLNPNYYQNMVSNLNFPYTQMDEEDRFYVEYFLKCDYGVYDLDFRIKEDKTRIEVTAI